MIKVIELIEPELERDNGFYRFLYGALRQCAGAIQVDTPRPLPRVMEPKVQESAWIRCDGNWVFFDMSDHVFSFDFKALELCSVYFKTNMNLSLTKQILSGQQLDHCLDKIKPFFSLAGNLHLYNPADWRNRIGVRTQRLDICHIVGLYEDLLPAGPPQNSDTLTPAQYHFWIRVQSRKAMENAGLTGYYRLTSRGNASIENERIRPNISQRNYMRRMRECRFTLINTLPHALPPWKVSESIAMHRPFIIERKPLIEIPQAFELVPDKHYLELLPDFGNFDEEVPLEDERRYRVLSYPSEDVLCRACEKIREKVLDKELFLYMSEQIKQFAEQRMTAGAIVDYVREQVESVV